jgi:hypothetical protein
MKGTPAYPAASQNDLGKWTGGNCFLDGGGSGVVTSAALNLRYNNCGWFGSDVATHLSTSPAQLTMSFWHGGNSTITIDHITFQ